MLLIGTGCVVHRGPYVQPIESDVPLTHVDMAEVNRFARWAKQVYESEGSLRAAYPLTQMIIKDLPRYEGRFFLVTDEENKTQTISIRGTSNKKNMLVDAESIKILDPILGIHLHKGFQKASNELWNTIVPFLRRDYEMQLTGHSLGGAMATILMMQMMETGYTVRRVITFGQPKVTNREGGEKFDNPAYLRIINNGDLVAQVPPSDLVFDLSGPFEHFGPEIILRGTLPPLYLTHHRPMNLFSEARWQDLTLQNAIDHRMENYLNQITP